MWPKERQAIHLQNLREHVDQSTPNVRRPRSKRWKILGEIAYRFVCVSGALLLVALFHQLFERGL